MSNIRSKLLVNKIIETVNSAKEKRLLTHDDIGSLFDLYSNAVKNDKITADNTELRKLAKGLNLVCLDTHC